MFVTNGATSTSQNVIYVAAVPAGVAAGQQLYDISNGNMIGTVQSTTSNTITLIANALSAVAADDSLTFGWLAVLNFANG